MSRQYKSNIIVVYIQYCSQYIFHHCFYSTVCIQHSYSLISLENLISKHAIVSYLHFIHYYHPYTSISTILYFATVFIWLFGIIQTCLYQWVFLGLWLLHHLTLQPSLLLYWSLHTSAFFIMLYITVYIKITPSYQHNKELTLYFIYLSVEDHQPSSAAVQTSEAALFNFCPLLSSNFSTSSCLQAEW